MDSCAFCGLTADQLTDAGGLTTLGDLTVCQVCKRREEAMIARRQGSVTAGEG